MGDVGEAFVKIRPDTQGFGENMKSSLLKIGAAVGGGLAVKELIDFGRESVKAFSEAEQSQLRLSDAYSKFPALAGANTKGLEDLATSLALKTRFDDDATKGAAAQLAQFGLTDAQLRKLIPLVQDFAARTGQDLPSAADAVGKAMLGQGRALKQVGIDFKDTGTAGGNFDEIMGGLSSQVGGFAEKEGKSAAGTAEILKNQFGELKESVGAALMPAIKALAPPLLKIIETVGPLVTILAVQLAPVITQVATAMGPVLTTIIKALNPVIGVLGKALGDIFIALLPLLPPLAKLLVAFIPLIPPLAKLIVLIADLLVPILNPLIKLITLVAEVLSKVLGGAINQVVKFLSPLQGIFTSISNAISGVIDWVKKFIDKLLSIKLPKWLTPGSPTPFEMGLRGVATAMRDVVRATPDELGFGVNIGPGGSIALGGSAGASAGRPFEVTVMLDGETIGRAVGPALVDSVRVKTGLRL